MPNHLSLQVGLFRKSGVKSRIQALRQMNESCGAGGGGVNYEGQSAYDVADMLKQYFRDLPEPLLTSKLSDTFLQIYQCKKMHRIHFHFLHCFVEDHTCTDIQNVVVNIGILFFETRTQTLKEQGISYPEGNSQLHKDCTIL